jgi:hypothetical protein
VEVWQEAKLHGKPQKGGYVLIFLKCAQSEKLALMLLATLESKFVQIRLDPNWMIGQADY